MWQCPRRHRANKGGQNNYPRPLNYPNVKNDYLICVYKPKDCIHATSFLLWLIILKCTITIVWVLVIRRTLGSQRFSRILRVEETLDIISSTIVGVIIIGVVLGNVFVTNIVSRTPLYIRTPYVHIRTGLWRFWLFPVCRLPSIFADAKDL